MSLCKLCKCPGCAVRGSEFDFASCPSYEPMTNADRIRAMTDEKLAEVVNDLFYGLHENPGMCDVCDHDSIQNCKQCWLDWLRQEAEG